MSWGLVAVAGATVVSGAMGSRAASKAASAEAASAEAGIEEQRRQFDEIRKLLQPYVEAGTPALEAQQAMLGFGGPAAERAQIAAVERSPMFLERVRQGEQALLQQASATGGLRGGNVQAALAQFRPALLAEELETRYGRLGGMVGLGQRSAVGVGEAGLATGRDVSGLLATQGAARSAGALRQANIMGGTLSDLAGIAGTAAGKGMFGGSTSPASGTAVDYSIGQGARLRAF